MKVRAYNIKWDTDNKEVNLNSEMTLQTPDFNDQEELEDFVADELSNQSGFCHYGFDYEVVDS